MAFPSATLHSARALQNACSPRLRILDTLELHTVRLLQDPSEEPPKGTDCARCTRRVLQCIVPAPRSRRLFPLPAGEWYLYTSRPRARNPSDNKRQTKIDPSCVPQLVGITSNDDAKQSSFLGQGCAVGCYPCPSGRRTLVARVAHRPSTHAQRLSRAKDCRANETNS